MNPEELPRGIRSGSRWLIASSIHGAIACALCLTCSVHAQTRPQARPYTIEGVEGLWLPGDLAREATAAREELPRERERYRLLAENLSIADRQIVVLREAVTLAERGREIMRDALADAQKASREDRAWYRDPSLWLAIGLVLGAAAVISAFAAAN